MGLQFENLVVSNAHGLFALLSINTQEIVFASPYFQRPTKEKACCQIDFLIHDKFNTLYLCEVKFSKGPIGADVIQEVKEKISYLVRPKYFSIRPVLIHVNGVTDAVVESEFFAKIIDFAQFLELPVK